MNWIQISQIFATVLNLGAVAFNIWNIRRIKKMYKEIADLSTARMQEAINDFDFHINRLAEENELLRTNEGLYAVRDNEEQYQMFLSLLRKK